MSEQTLRDPAPTTALGESRSRVLDVLRTVNGPVGVQKIAEQANLHPNTVRFHLDGLVKEGLVEQRLESRSQPGRPRTLYLAVATQVPASQRSYRLLAEMLTALVTETLPQPAEAAVSAGEAWGRYLADSAAPGQRVDAAEAIRRLSKLLEDVGFSPGPLRDQADPVIPLRHCPFREIAEEHREVVCSLHLGLMRGALKEVRAPLGVDRLEPFVEPSLCLAHLTPLEQRPGRAEKPSNSQDLWTR